jgi:hypothetical protein
MQLSLVGDEPVRLSRPFSRSRRTAARRLVTSSLVKMLGVAGPPPPARPRPPCAATAFGRVIQVSPRCSIFRGSRTRFVASIADSRERNTPRSMVGCHPRGRCLVAWPWSWRATGEWRVVELSGQSFVAVGHSCSRISGGY